MNFGKYLKDVWLEIFCFFFLSFLIFLLLSVFHTPIELILVISSLQFLFGIFLLLFSYFRKRKFYQSFLSVLNSLDQKYLISEMLEEPNFLEGKVLYNAIYEIDKSMNERLNSYKRHMNDFKEYIELWVHEIKIPISSCFLVLHNHVLEDSKKIEKEISRIEDFVEQILYYARCENVEKDYLIRKCSLKQIVKNMIQKNKRRILCRHLSLDIEIGDTMVRTDSKWLEFILHQIINNSIQYCRERKGNIRIFLEEEEGKVYLKVWDNGIGITKEDLSRVFEKGFTGENGRKISSSTGMGLYLCKILAEKMGHTIEIDSLLGEYTCVTITFFETDFYKVLDESYKTVRNC